MHGVAGGWGLLAHRKCVEHSVGVVPKPLRKSEHFATNHAQCVLDCRTPKEKPSSNGKGPLKSGGAARVSPSKVVRARSCPMCTTGLKDEKIVSALRLDR